MAATKGSASQTISSLGVGICERGFLFVYGFNYLYVYTLPIGFKFDSFNKRVPNSQNIISNTVKTWG